MRGIDVFGEDYALVFQPTFLFHGLIGFGASISHTYAQLVRADCRFHFLPHNLCKACHGSSPADRPKLKGPKRLSVGSDGWSHFTRGMRCNNILWHYAKSKSG